MSESTKKVLLARGGGPVSGLSGLKLTQRHFRQLSVARPRDTSRIS